VLVRRTLLAVAVIVIGSVPFVVFAAISGDVAAASLVVLGGVAVVSNLLFGGQSIAISRWVC
jgi:hypothetical protein